MEKKIADFYMGFDANYPNGARTWAIVDSIGNVDDEAHQHPDSEPDPGLAGQLGHQEHIDQNGTRGNQRHWIKQGDLFLCKTFKRSATLWNNKVKKSSIC